MARPQEFDTSEVLHKAMYVFWDKGYEAASLSDLLEATGLSKSSLYAAFGDKRALFLAAFAEYRRTRLQFLRNMLNDGQTARNSIESFFRYAVARSQDDAGARGCMTANEAIELAPHDAEVQQLVADDFHAIEEAFARTIVRGQADGSIANQQKPRTLARFLLVGLQGLQVIARAQSGRARLDDAVSVMMAALD
jgi:TetR/AcrR family transcriptional repressor of nem operon